MTCSGRASAITGTLSLTAIAALVLVRCSTFGEEPPGPDAGAPDAPDAPTGADAAPVCPPDTRFDTDARNCGVCARDCGKGECFAGTCSSYVISESGPVPSPWYIAADDDPNGFVYWTSYLSIDNPGGDGSIRRAPKRGGPVEVVVPTGGFAFDVIVDGDRLVYTTNADHSVRTVPKLGGVDPTTLWKGTSASNLARVENRIFFTGAVGGLGGVFELANTTVSQLATFEQNRSPEGIAATSTTIFWANHRGANGEGATASVGRVERGGDQLLKDWIPGQTSARLVAVDDTDVYWTSDQLDVVMRKERIGSGSPSLFYPGRVGYGGIVVDGNFGYITVQRENKVVRAAKDLSGGRDLVKNLQNPLGIAQDAKAIYFVENTGGRVHRLVK